LKSTALSAVVIGLMTLMSMHLPAVAATWEDASAAVEADWIDQDRRFGQPPAEPFSLAHIKATIARGRKLAARLQGQDDTARLTPLVDELAALEGRLNSLASAGNSAEDARRQAYLDARRTLRRIAMANPLVAIDKLLFVKRQDAKGVFHMCDQFYGFNAVPGGGIFRLDNPWGPEPTLVNLLENSVVEEGRLQGRKLEPGSFLSPELSYDGQMIYFAYTEAKGKDLEWSPEASYHLFRCRADGTGLVQLTDGPWNDFDPCLLPNGRVAFISERRGGFLRCGRHCPVYTLFSMQPDGGDVVCLSYHETHEWQPSVTNDGMIVYTRWDYVDRDTNVAHHLWTCYPDGRDPRSFHGNYPRVRQSRPWMEMSIRAIPGSNKFVAVTGAHHGHAFGSLVLIDPRPEDDGAMSQITRLTPEAPFPEAEGKPTEPYMVYGTPWPLSEDDYLCAYDARAKNHGIYWIDRDGNKELLYRDPQIASLDPIPLRARRCPPVLPSKTIQTAEDRQARPDASLQATVAVMNVYNSDFAWPSGAKVKSLRVIQVLPKSTAPPNVPRIGTAQQTNARAVLGTVPVEEDGSALFEVPAGRAIYFQALDDRGLAIQSMRSATYLHPGERLTCQGCHEPKRRPPARIDEAPLALRRGPSTLQPGPDGSNPFSYVRLVQPVLDRNCVGCHAEKKALELGGALDGPNGWSRSYVNLAAKYGFYFDVTNGSISGAHGGSRTVAGKFGAPAARLMKYLNEKHYGVKLSDEDFQRVTLWLDANSEFYGSYENVAEQARGEVVEPTLQ
jgi:hypothetical protein